jgi:hypothetical protein
MYRTRIGLQTMVANVRRGSGALGHFRGNFGGNWRCPNRVTPWNGVLCRKGFGKNACNYAAQVLRIWVRVRTSSETDRPHSNSRNAKEIAFAGIGQKWTLITSSHSE